MFPSTAVTEDDCSTESKTDLESKANSTTLEQISSPINDNNEHNNNDNNSESEVDEHNSFKEEDEEDFMDEAEEFDLFATDEEEIKREVAEEKEKKEQAVRALQLLHEEEELLRQKQKEEQERLSDFSRFQLPSRRKYGPWVAELKVFSPVFSTQENHAKLAYGDKVLLPPSVLQQLTDRRVWLPTMFQLKNDKTNKTAHCSVLEFIAPEGVMYVPSWLMYLLEVQDGDNITIKNLELPKGSYTKLRCVTGNLLAVSNHKALLEHTLPKCFATLSTGTTITINHQEEEYGFEVVELKPADSCCILNTDIEVDFVQDCNKFSSSASQQDSDLKGSLFKNPKYLVPKKEKEPQVNSMLGFSLNSGEQKCVLSSLGNSLSNSLLSETTTASATSGDSSTSSEATCTNCGDSMPKSKLNLHEPMCCRLFTKCDICKQKVKKTFKQEHMDQYHKLEQCKLCGASIDASMLAEHAASLCPNRKTRCEYCELSVKNTELLSHMNHCGSRTRPCEQCGEFVQLKHLAMHQINNCAPSTAQNLFSETYEDSASFKEPYTAASPATSSGMGDSLDALMFCPVCMAPFQDFTLLQVHVTSHEDTANANANDSYSHSSEAESKNAF